MQNTKLTQGVIPSLSRDLLALTNLSSSRATPEGSFIGAYRTKILRFAQNDILNV